MSSSGGPPGPDAAPPRRRGSIGALLGGRGVWGLADQGVASLGNYLTGLAVLHALPKQDFAVFFLVFGGMVFVNSLHAALVTYPLSLRGATASEADLRRRTGEGVALTLALLAPLALAAVLAALWEPGLAVLPWAVGVLVLWQVQETVRRGLMAHLRHREALPGDAVSYLGQAALVFLLARHGLLSLEAVFAAMAVTSLLGLLLQLRRLRPVLARRPRPLALLAEDWARSRWMLMTSAITLLTVQAVPWTLGLAHGMEAVAEFGALAQIMGLTNFVMIAVTGLVMPATAQAAPRGMAAALRVGRFYGLQGAALLLPFYAAVVLAPAQVIRLVTDGAEYDALAAWLPIYAILYGLSYPAHVMQAVLNGLGLTRSSFAAQGVFSGVTLLVRLPLAALYGLPGAVWGGLLPELAFPCAAALMLRRAVRASPPRAAAPPGSAPRPATRGGPA